MRLTDVLAPPLCVACSGWAGRAVPFCATCRAQIRWLGADVVQLGVEAWAPVAYAGPARGAVTALKFRGAWRTADAMAAAVCANAPPGWLDGGVLVPAPLHPARLRKRGFNQAERLASAIGRRAGLEVWDCLARLGSNTTQMGRSRKERLTGMDVRLTGTNFHGTAVLVDDVVTTGATLASCAAVLRQAGVSSLRAIAYARTPGR